MQFLVKNLKQKNKGKENSFFEIKLFDKSFELKKYCNLNFLKHRMKEKEDFSRRFSFLQINDILNNKNKLMHFCKNQLYPYANKKLYVTQSTSKNVLSIYRNNLPLS